MMKALKMGFFGLAMGAIGAVALPAQDAHAQGDSSPNASTSSCKTSYTICQIAAKGNAMALLQCQLKYTACMSN
ncbi:hypothetical protein [Cystobacter fuscus]|uniref:hypothetical protein n=1 Tax=Cystobacter fuscus TaxID=43 RepID=UPI002B2D6027|nr:hypothetical protein F0U63_18705 [Cystobacter fuscus]